MEDFRESLWQVIMFFPQAPLLYEDDYRVIRVIALVAGVAVGLVARGVINEFPRLALSCASKCALMAALMATFFYFGILREANSSHTILMNSLYALYGYISLYIAFVLTAILLYLPRKLIDKILDCSTS